MFGNSSKGIKSSEKISFLKNVKFYSKQNVLNGLKSNLFPIESENISYSTPRGSKINVSELDEFSINDIRYN